MDEIMNTSQQTPIEIVLGIDSQGRTTAKKLYEFLELDKSHYNRWCKTNILNNKFAEEDIDYWKLAMDDEVGNLVRHEGRTKKYQPNPTADYKLTASFAKKLAMASGSPKGEEAREYFLRTETALKDVAIKRDAELLQMKAACFDMRQLLESSNREMEKMRCQLQALESRQNESDNRRFENTYENRVASEFFKILDDVLTSDDHSFAIKPKNYHGSLELLGICDEKYIYIRKRRCYDIYEYFASEPVRQQILWNILYQTGYADGLASPNQKMCIFGWGNEPVLALYRNRLEHLIKNKV